MVRSEGTRGRACEREGRRGGRGKGGEKSGEGVFFPLSLFFFLARARKLSFFLSLVYTRGLAPPPPQPRGGEGVADDARKGGTLFFVERGVLSFDQTRQRKRPPAPAAGPRPASAYPPPASHRGRRREAAAHGGLSVAWCGVAERAVFTAGPLFLADPRSAQLGGDHVGGVLDLGGREGGGRGEGGTVGAFHLAVFFFLFIRFRRFCRPPVSPSLFRFVRTVAMASALSSSSVISNFS
jgi:hypothetical protein